MNTDDDKANTQRKSERAGWPDPARVRCIGGFHDGNLTSFFEGIGQDPVIHQNEVRELPLWLLERCIQSGGKFEYVFGG
jgi:hypothetical protein